MSQLITCPECKKHLQVPDELIGKKVQCPECRYTFTAEESTPTEVVTTTSTTASKPGAAAGTAPKKAEWDRDDDEKEDTRKSKAPPKKRRNDDDDDDHDDDEDDDRLSRRRRRSNYGGRRSDYMPHRGGMILAFGIISLVSTLLAPVIGVTFIFPLIFGPMAWLMGNADMAEIHAGRMDPEGESMIQTGRIMGIISTILIAAGIIGICGCCGIVMIAGGMKGPRG
jgi:hypothetical protein